jgi:hypothetical protein
MPLSEVLFEINDPVAARLALRKVLETNGYKITQNSIKKIVAKHKLSVTRYGHMVEIEFDPPTDQCIEVTVTLRIDHNDSTTYIKSLFEKLSKVFPNMKVTSVKPKMSLNYKTPVNVAALSEPVCKQIGDVSASWKCQNCGLNNNLTQDICTGCGEKRHTLEMEEEESFTDVEEETDESQEDDTKDIY